jgi:uncharacterized protein YndB with AHSA1/START domain
MSEIANTSNEAVHKSTGKTWGEWTTFLEQHGARELSHKGIVKLLKEKGQLNSGWWHQMITNTYEQYIGRRKKGEMAGGFQVGVSKTLPLPATRIWDWLLSPAGLATWLNADNIPPQNAKFVTNDGIRCELRVLNQGSHLRMRWQPEEWEKPSTLQLRVTGKGEKATLTFHQENMPDEQARDKMKRHWKAVAESIAKQLHS